MLLSITNMWEKMCLITGNRQYQSEHHTGICDDQQHL